VSLGGSYCNLGHLLTDTGSPKEGLGWQERAVVTLEGVVAREPSRPTARQFLRNSHWGRAEALDALGRHAEAAAAWERAAALDDGPNRLYYGTRRALSQARAGRAAPRPEPIPPPRVTDER